MKLVFAIAALTDLKDIARWIAAENPRRARTFSAELRRACRSLTTQSERYPVVRERGGDEIRKRLHRNYLIPYRVSGSQVEIVRIVHGSRDWAALLGEGE